MYTVAITGATGFVGNFVALYLEKKGFHVVRFGRKNLDGIHSWDITQGPYPEKVHIDCVVHCAAVVSDWASYKSCYAVNVQGTRHVLQSFSSVSKFIYISSASVYDTHCKKHSINEESCVGGKLLNHYSTTKLIGEQEVFQSSIPSKIILRPHIIYGPGDKKIAPRIRNAIRFGRFPVLGNGKNHISFTHIENLAQAIWLCVKKDSAQNAIYNITDEQSFPFIEALTHIKKLNNLTFKEFLFLPQ
jgi:nucleoside-diphosphate-sugar epimerase